MIEQDPLAGQVGDLEPQLQLRQTLRRDDSHHVCQVALPMPAAVLHCERFIEERFTELAVPVMKTRLYDREAFRAMFSSGGTIAGLSNKSVSNLATALQNAREYTAEIVDRLRGTRGEKTKEVA